MDFITIAKSGIEGTAEVPETAFPHWESYGWYRVDTTAQENPVTDLAGTSDTETSHKPVTTKASRRTFNASNAETTEESK